ncbi:MAG: hypothetical protein HY864_13370 [Chloroflexi bacterium]|nr:hypothetical protein [Chloroflexota bacterium]
MATISFKGICSGTNEKVSTKKGTKYKITSFVEIPSLNKFEVFGDLGLSPHDDPREYTFEAGIVGLSNVVVKQASPAKKS